MKNNIQTEEELDVFYTSIQQRKFEVIKNLIYFALIGFANIIGSIIAVSKYGYIGYFLTFIASLFFFIGSFQIALLFKLKKGTEQAVWKFTERSQSYTTDYHAGISEKILSLRFVKTVVLNSISPNTCRVKVLSSNKNSITKKYTFEIDLSLDQVDLFCDCLSKHGIEKYQIQNHLQANQTPHECL